MIDGKLFSNNPTTKLEQGRETQTKGYIRVLTRVAPRHGEAGPLDFGGESTLEDGCRGV